MTNKKSSLLKILSFIITTSILVSVMPYFSMTTKAAENRDRIIVSMGDSYSSGEGIEPYYGSNVTPLEKKVGNQDWLAHRSKESWSSKLTLPAPDGSRIKMDKYDEYDNPDGNWYFVATTGAVTYDIGNDKKQDYKKSVGTGPEGALKGPGIIDAQIKIFDTIDNKNQTVDYVTITIGGNDAEFAKVMETAAKKPAYLSPNSTYNMLSSLVNNKLPNIQNDLVNTYKMIYERSKARIIVAGYPELLGYLGGALFPPFEAELINNSVDIFNNSINEVVTKCQEGIYDDDKKETIKIPIYFVSVKDAFQGRGAYSLNPYINGVSFPPTAEDRDDWNPVGGASFHPNEKGVAAYAKCVQDEIDYLERTPRPNPTEKPTDKAVEIPTHKPTETKEYTAVELASKSLDEIIEIMGGDYTSEHIQLSNAFSSSGAPYIYNYDVLPGFAFETYDNYYRGISIMDGAKLNDKISSDMTYNQIADVIGDMEGMLVAQEGNIACSKTVDGYDVAFCFIENGYIRKNKDNSGKISSDILRGGNPSLQSIGLIMNTEPESEEQPMNNSFGMSDKEVKSMLTSDRWILQEVYVDGERYQGNYYGSIIRQTGAYIEFDNDGTFECVLGFVGCSGSYSVKNGNLTVTITQEFVDAKTNEVEETNEIGWRSEDNTILFDYSAFDSGENVTNAFRQL